ncbi:MAG: DUF421 domain-containing protein [Ruminococcus sp.]
MLVIKTIILTFVSISVLFILAKLMGNKQISQLSTFDYINGITIGSIAAELATSDWKDFAEPLIAMIIYGLAAVLISYLSLTTMPIRRFFSGKTTVIYDNGKFYKENLKKCKLDVGEFLTLLRGQGYFNIKEIESAFLESNGMISVLPKSDKKPMTPYDMGMKPTKAKAEPIVVMDGKTLYKNLKLCGKDEQWLMSKLKDNGVKLEDVFIAQTDGENELSVYVNTHKADTNDRFQ